VVGKSGTIGAHAPIAAGVATAIQIRGEDGVVVSLFGDGASNRGTTHSAFNMAAIARLPVVWVCENNGYCGSAPLSTYAAKPDIWEMAAAYGMPGKAVDGNDVVAVHEAGGQALDRARSGHGPSLIELKTYRIRPFSEAAADDRDPAEIEAWSRRDPIERFERELVAAGLLGTGDSGDIRAAARREMEAALAEAEQSPFPDPSEAFEGVFT
jgi:pyruvate dehydrogenase E1 component alpha subunit